MTRRAYYFDVDGTIVDTYALNKAAYRQVGIDMPDDAWGLPWRHWLPRIVGDDAHAKIIHERKIQVYDAIIANPLVELIELPAAGIARTRLLKGDKVVFLTASSYGTAYGILSRLGLLSNLHAGLDYPRRFDYLRVAPSGSVYVDDNVETIKRLNQDTSHLKLVLYTDQTYDELAREIATHVFTDRNEK